MTSARFPLGPFTPYDGNPVLRPQGSTWESANLYNPAAAVVGDQVMLLYRAHGDDLVSRLGIATSDDGRTFVREADPVLEPEHDYEAKGCEDPRLALCAATDEPWLTPTTEEDQVGLVANVTFVQGLVQFRGEWLAYYGQADTTLALATARLLDP